MSIGNVEIVDFDTAALPKGLLSLAKSHLRVRWTDDDDYITNAIGRAIAWFEAGSGVTVNGATFKWSPVASDFCNGLAKLPETPVALDGWTVTTGDDDNPTDISASYSVTTLATKGVGIYALEGAFVSGMAVTFDSGYWSVSELPAGILNILLLYTAHLFENREILVPGAQASTPGWMTDVFAPYWVPRV